MSGNKINFKKRGLKHFIVLATVTTQLLGATQIFAYSNSMGNPSKLETKNLGVPELPNPNQYPEWDSRAYYTVGDRVIYNGQIWEALVSFQGHGDMNWAPALDSTLWRLIGDVLEPEPDTPDEVGEISDGFEYRFHEVLLCNPDSNLWIPDCVVDNFAVITGFNGTHNNVLIPHTVVNGGKTYRVAIIERDAFANKGLKRVKFQSELLSIGTGAFAGNPLQAIDIPSSSQFFRDYLRNGMQGVTTETVLYEGGVPTHQWNGNNAWIPTN